MEIKLDRGLKSYEIKDMDGTLLGVIRINPADVGILARLGQAKEKTQAIAAQFDALGDAGDDAALAQVAGLEQDIREQVNYIFGCDASAVFFKGCSALTLCEDGALLLEKVFAAITPLLLDAVGDAAKKSAKRVAKHTAKYTAAAPKA